MTMALLSKGVKKIKIGIWLYLILLIFEGGLRKWFLPGLATPLLIIRDPLAIWLLFMASKENIIYSNAYTKFMFPFTILCTYVALWFCHHNILIALFGARITLLHFPIVFLIGKVMNKEDIESIGQFIVYLTIPMLVLVVIQFYSPQSAWINRGVGGNTEGAGFAGAGEFLRPPGTFSFTSGNSSYFAFAAPFIFYFLFYSQKISRTLVITSLIALLLSIFFSISRTILFSISITLIFVIITFANQARQIGRILGGIIILLVVIYFASKTKALETGIGAFITRFTQANESEGGLEGVFIDRVLGGLINGIAHAGDTGKSFWGLGIGYGTNVAAALLSKDGSVVFLIDEAEWGREIGELGILFGLTLIFIRISMTLDVVRKCRIMLRKRETLPWLLLSFSFLNLLQGGWSTPTALGFYTVSAGFTLASMRSTKTINDV